MKKFFLSIILALLVLASVLVLRFWNNWNQTAEIEAINVEFNQESYQIGEVITATVIIKAPLFYDLELNTALPLPEGLQHFESSTTKQRIMKKDSNWVFTESFFATEQKNFEPITRQLFFHGVENKNKLNLEARRHFSNPNKDIP